MSLKIGRRFIVLNVPEPCAAAGVHYVGDRIPLFLGPGRAFGSGDHETTSSCLEEIECLPVGPETRVLDLGSGTGILAVAAAKMGAGVVMAVDTSADAFESTLRNAELNSVQTAVLPLLGGLEQVKEERFGIILANLYGEVLLGLVPDLIGCLQPGGFLVLSGVHYDFNYELRMAFTDSGLKLLKNRFLENYTTLVFNKAS